MDAAVPNSVAIPVTTVAIHTDRQAAFRISVFCHRRRYHSVENAKGN